MEQTKKNEAGKGRLELFINLFPFISLAVVVIGLTVLSGGKLIQLANIRRIFEQSFAQLLVAGAVIFLLTQDCLDMSVGATIGMAGAVAAYASQKSIPLALFAALAAGCAIGIVNGFLNGVLRLNTMICTLAMQFILRGLLLIICKSGSVAIAMEMYDLDSFGLKLAVCAVYLTAAWLIFQYHIYGKHCRAVGAGKLSAIQSGINIQKTCVIGYIFSGTAAGLAGFFTAIRTGAALYNTGNMVELDTLIALILGGMAINGGVDSRFRSAIIGVMILGVLNNGMVLMGLDTYPQLITKGLVFILVLALTFTLRNKVNKNRKS